MCSISIDSIAKKLAQSASGLASPQQLKVARDYFAAALYEAGSQRGKSKAQVDSDRARRVDANDEGTNARIAMACIQRLQDGT